MNRLMTATAAVLLFATPAFASHCPKDAAAIDAALAKMSVSDGLKAEVLALKDQGMELHAAGSPRESEAMLADAMRRLLTGE